MCGGMPISLTYRLTLSRFSYFCRACLIKGAAVVGGLFVFLKISWCGLEFPSYLHFLSLPSGKAHLHVCCSLVIFNDSFISFSSFSSNVYT